MSRASSRHRNAPDEHKTFIADVFDQFQMREVITAVIPAEKTLVTVADTALATRMAATRKLPDNR